MEEPEPTEVDPSDIGTLAAGQLLEWCDGDSSAHRVVHHMRNAEQYGMAHPMVHRICQAGVGQHAHGGLMAMLDKTGLGRLLTPMDGGS